MNGCATATVPSKFVVVSTVAVTLVAFDVCALLMIVDIAVFDESFVFVVPESRTLHFPYLFISICCHS